MNLTPEQQEIGRRNFLKAAAGVPAVAALGAAASMKGPKKGGPVKAAIIGSGSEGKVLLNQCQKQWIDIRAICDINPAHSKGAADGLADKGLRRPREYQDLKQMLEKEDLEAVLIATPLWSHADLDGAVPGRRQARAVREDDGLGRAQLSPHDRRRGPQASGCWRSVTSVSTTPPTTRPSTAILKKGLLGDVFHIRTVWHRNASWRRKEAPRQQGLRSQAVGLRELGSPGELAPVPQVQPRPAGRAGQPPDRHHQLVLRGRARGGLLVGRRLPLRQRGARGARPRVRDVRLQGRPHGHLQLDRVEQVRRHLRADHGDQGHAHHEGRDRVLLFPRGDRDRGRQADRPGGHPPHRQRAGRRP